MGSPRAGVAPQAPRRHFHLPTHLPCLTCRSIHSCNPRLGLHNRGEQQGPAVPRAGQEAQHYPPHPPPTTQSATYLAAGSCQQALESRHLLAYLYLGSGGWSDKPGSPGPLPRHCCMPPKQKTQCRAVMAGSMSPLLFASWELAGLAPTVGYCCIALCLGRGPSQAGR